MAISYVTLFMLSIAAILMVGTVILVRRSDRQNTLLSRSNEAELSRIIFNIEDAVFVIDNHSRIVMANTEMHRMVSLPKGELDGATCSTLFSLPIPTSLMSDAIADEREVELYRQNDEILNVKLKGLALVGERDNRIGTLVKLWDPVRAGRGVTSKETLEQLWETLLAKQSTDLEQKNRELEQSGAQLQQLVERIGSIKDQEGIRISRVLSGELSGLLASIRTNVAKLRDGLGEAFEKRVDSILEVIDSASSQVESIIEGIRPSVLDGGHLGEAIEKVAGQFEKIHRIELKNRINISATRLDIDLSTAIFRIAQESLTNIARHSQATKAQMSLLDTSDGVALVVEDNGRGVEREELETASALGVLGMKERAKSVGGRLDISNREGGGCVVSLFVPIQR